MSVSKSINKLLESKIEAVDIELESLNERVFEAERIRALHQRTLDRKGEALKGAGQRLSSPARKKLRLDVTEDRFESKSQVVRELRARINYLLEAKDLLSGVFSYIRTQADELCAGDEFHIAPSHSEWQRSLPNSRFKTFQELFTPPQFRVLPSHEGPYSDVESHNQIPIDRLVFDPARLQDSFVDAFGLADLTGLSDNDKLKIKIGLKEVVARIFSEARLLERMNDFGAMEGNPRVYVVHGMGPEHDGKVINVHYTSDNPFDRDPDPRKRRRKDIKPLNERKITAVYPDAYSFDRRNYHALNGYGAEISDLARALRKAEALHRKALSPLPPPDSDDYKNAMKRIAKDLDYLQSLFGTSSDFDKQEVAKIASAIVDFKDSLGRPNPAASAASLLRATEHLSARHCKASGREMAMHEDKQSMMLAIAEGEEVLRDCYYALIRICSLLEEVKPYEALDYDGESDRARGSSAKSLTQPNLLPAFYQYHPLLDPHLYDRELPDEPLAYRAGFDQETSARLQDEFKQILSPITLLSDPTSLRLRPFNFFAERIHQKLEDSDAAVEGGDYEAACMEALRAFVFSKLFQVHRELKDLEKLIAVESLDFSLGDIAQKFRNLAKILDHQQVFKGMGAQIYPEAYGYYKAMVQAVVDTLTRIDEEGLKGPERQEALIRLKEQSLSHIFPEELLLEE